VIRAGVLAVNTPLAKARLRRTLAKTPRPLRLEIGGLTKRDGWVITNVNAVTRNYLDATRRWPLEDGSVSLVYADNVIEHIPLAATLGLGIFDPKRIEHRRTLKRQISVMHTSSLKIRHVSCEPAAWPRSAPFRQPAPARLKPVLTVVSRLEARVVQRQTW